nr:replication protein A 70 kDa DNA-binding subunit B-like isoform X2 [Coffea arabica]
MITPVLNFTDFKKFRQYIDIQSEIDVLAAAIQVQPRNNRGTTPLRNIIVIDQGCIPTILTLWGAYELNEGQAIADIIDSQPIIAALKVKVSSYHTVNLSTKPGSAILINPPIEQAATIKSWIQDNRAKIEQMLLEKTYENRAVLLPMPPIEELTSIRDFLNLPLQKSCWLQGTPTLLDKSQKL